MLDRKLHFILLRCFQNMNRLIMQEANKLCLFFGQPKILEYLLENDGAKSIDIACGCVLDKSTVASLLARMEERNLVRREADENDGRAYNIFLTDLGLEKAMAMSKVGDELDQYAFRGISKEEQEAFIDTMEKIIGNLTGKKNNKD